MGLLSGSVSASSLPQRRTLARAVVPETMGLGSKAPEKRNTAAGKVKLQGVMATNVLEMLNGTDDAANMKQKLLTIFGPDQPRFSPMKNATTKMLRYGWEKELESSQTFVTNIGVTAALILSVTLGLVLSPVDEAVASGDSMWDDYRGVMADVTFTCFSLASASALLCVVTSLLWVNASIAHVHDADDFMWFMETFQRGAAVTWLVICLLLTGTGMATVPTVVWDDTAASLCFFASLAAILATLVWYLDKELKSRRHTANSMASLNELCVAAINEAWEQFTDGSEGAVAPSS